MMKIRYIIVIYICFMLIAFVLPNFFIGQVISNDMSIIDNNKMVKVFLSKTGEEIELELDEYIKGVVAAEMPSTYEIEALKAQAVVARTYTLNKINQKKLYGNDSHPNSDICDDIYDCQAYVSENDKIKQWDESNLDSNNLWNKIEEAVDLTKDEVILYNNEPIKAFFHANSGGQTENVELVWKGEPIEYLKSVATSGENNYSQYKSNAEYTYAEINEIMKKKYSNYVIDFNKEDCIKVISRSDSNRVLQIKIGNIEISGVDARNLFSLKSTNFECIVESGKVKFNVIGYGHGIGMSQTGANELAKNGYTYEEIIHHFYTNVEIKKIN